MCSWTVANIWYDHFSVETFQPHRTDGRIYDNPLVKNGISPEGQRYGDPNGNNQHNDPNKMWHKIIPYGLIPRADALRWDNLQNNPIVHKLNFLPGGFPSVNAVLGANGHADNIFYYDYTHLVGDGNVPPAQPAVR